MSMVEKWGNISVQQKWNWTVSRTQTNIQELCTSSSGQTHLSEDLLKAYKDIGLEHAERVFQGQETQRTPSRHEQKQSSPWHVILNSPTVKQRHQNVRANTTRLPWIGTFLTSRSCTNKNFAIYNIPLKNRNWKYMPLPLQS